MEHTARRNRVLVVLVGALIGAIGYFGAAAGAQTPTTSCQAADPYGCVNTTTTSADQTASPSASLEAHAGTAGSSVGANACGYRAADAGTSGDITFNGESVATVSIDDDGCLAAQTGTGSALPAGLGGELAAGGYPVRFTVPELPPRAYEVCTVFAGYPTPCDNFTITRSQSETQVLSGGTERNPGAGGGSGGGAGSSGGGSLARTGTSILAFLLAAAVLMTSGRLLVERSKRLA
jgi:hypothetical protein